MMTSKQGPMFNVKGMRTCVFVFKAVWSTANTAFAQESKYYFSIVEK